MITIYGIPNCDTCRKARRWLTDNGIEHRFHDFRADGLPSEALDDWCAALGWEAVLNRRSTSWKQVAEADRAGIDETAAKRLILEAPTLVKRPVIDRGAGAEPRYLIGFGKAQQQSLAP